MTEFAETNVLLYVLEDDLERARRCLAEFLVWELDNLGAAVIVLQGLVYEEIHRKLRERAS